LKKNLEDEKRLADLQIKRLQDAVHRHVAERERANPGSAVRSVAAFQP
jgi:hypothetical protein